jgi:hypothetical protein
MEGERDAVVLPVQHDIKSQSTEMSLHNISGKYFSLKRNLSFPWLASNNKEKQIKVQRASGPRGGVFPAQKSDKMWLKFVFWYLRLACPTSMHHTAVCNTLIFF